MNEEIIRKYNVPVPRYTSYPTANTFHNFTEEEYLRSVKASNNALADQISFYIHVPFCKDLCHYCGCNSINMASGERIEKYFQSLHQEIDLLLPYLRKDRKISQIHYGGGSPSSMPLHYIREVNEHLLGAFSTIEQPEIAIECHPAYLTEEDWQYLVDSHFTRFSLGIQDFNEDVLAASNRLPSRLPIAKILSILRQKGAKVNFDFIYGLSLQTVESFKKTIQTAIDLHPDRLVTFSYAHLPSMFPRQKVLDKIGLPSQETKLEMFEQAAHLLTQAGYQRVGMDHFVLPGDDLEQALRKKQLHRNFQGYCPRRITAQVYAFGVSGISQLDEAYAQNTKSLSYYHSSIASGHLPIQRGYALTAWQRVAREVIECLMCNNYLDWREMGERLHLSEDQVKAAMHYDVAQLEAFQHDGLIFFNEHTISMTTEGAAFVRNVAAALDRMLIGKQNTFSKPV